MQEFNRTLLTVLLEKEDIFVHKREALPATIVFRVKCRVIIDGFLQVSSKFGGHHIRDDFVNLQTQGRQGSSLLQSNASRTQLGDGSQVSQKNQQGGHTE